MLKDKVDFRLLVCNFNLKESAWKQREKFDHEAQKRFFLIIKIITIWLGLDESHMHCSQKCIIWPNLSARQQWSCHRFSKNEGIWRAILLYRWLFSFISSTLTFKEWKKLTNYFLSSPELNLSFKCMSMYLSACLLCHRAVLMWRKCRVLQTMVIHNKMPTLPYHHKSKNRPKNSLLQRAVCRAKFLKFSCNFKSAGKTRLIFKVNSFL